MGLNSDAVCKILDNIYVFKDVADAIRSMSHCVMQYVYSSGRIPIVYGFLHVS